MGKAAVEIIIVDIALLKIYGKFVWVWPVLDKKKKKNMIDSSQISLDQDGCMVLFSK